MPEGPSIVILKELLNELELEGSEVIAVSGNTKIDKERILNQPLIGFRSWGKHFLICFEDFTLRIHFMLFGSYLINENKVAIPRLTLTFENDFINFYACSLAYIEGNLSDTYDWEADVMNDKWNPKKAIKKLKTNSEVLVCDALLDQQIFSGVGNIIKNEVLYRVKIDPNNTLKNLPSSKLKTLVDEARNYSFDFLKWKKEYTLKKHWLIHTKKYCSNGHPVIKEYLGKTNRRTFYCTVCQKLYKKSKS